MLSKVTPWASISSLGIRKMAGQGLVGRKGGGWLAFVEAKNCCITSNAWARAFSWWRTQLLLYHLSGHLLQMFSLIRLRTSQYNFQFTICPGGTNSFCMMSSMSKKIGDDFTLLQTCLHAFFGRNEVGVLHWDDCCLVSVSYPNTQDSSPVMMLAIKLGLFSAHSLSSVQTAMWYSFWSLLSTLGTYFAALHCMLSSSYKMCWHVPYSSPTKLRTSWIVACRSSWIAFARLSHFRSWFRSKVVQNALHHWLTSICSWNV